MRSLLLIAMLLLSASANAATTYYIAATGADTNNGTAKGTPLAHAPGMRGCSNTCAGITPAGDDQYIFKGGDTWGNANFVWYWNAWSGTSGHPIYIGVDQTWFTGGSWTRPIFTANGMLTTTPPSHSFAVDQILSFDNSTAYVTVDNFEWTGAYCNAQPPASYGNNYIGAGNSTNMLIENNYFHGWTEDSPVTDTCWTVLLGTTGATYNAGGIFTMNVIDGSDAVMPPGATCLNATPCSGVGIYQWPTVQKNIFRYLTDGEITGGGMGTVQETSNNLFEYINRDWGLGHDNVYENNGGTALFYNNLIRHVTTSVKIWFEPCFSATDYYFNNVLYDASGTNLWNITNQAPCNGAGSSAASVVMYNNTLDQSGQLINPNNQNASITVQNTHCITSAGSCFSATYGNMTTSNNLVQTEAVANGQGYTSGNQYAPTTGGSTIGAGSNLYSSCSGSLTNLCKATTLGVTYNAVNHTVSYPTITAIARPNAAFDDGAYEYQGSPAAQGIHFGLLPFFPTEELP